MNDAYSTAVIDSLPHSPWLISSHKAEAPKPERKPRKKYATAEEKRIALREADKRYRENNPQKVAEKKQRERLRQQQLRHLKAAANRVNKDEYTSTASQHRAAQRHNDTISGASHSLGR